MSSRIVLLAFFMLASGSNAYDKCRRMTFVDQIYGKNLTGHVIRSFPTNSCEFCQIQCYLEKKCVSYNCGRNNCDLNSSDNISHPNDLVDDENTIYRETENACHAHRCPLNATCLNGFTDKGYKCECKSGFTGDNCEKAIVHGGWSHWSGWSLCSAQSCGEKGNRTRYRNCTSPAPENGGDPCHGSNVSNKLCKALPCSCKEIHQTNPAYKAIENKAYNLSSENGKVSAFCHMTDIPGCGSGWTLVMKIDGSKSRFHYHSVYWTNKASYNEQGGLTGLDDKETKLPTYWSTPFTKICLGMKVQGERRFLLINRSASSLYSLIVDGEYKSTSLGRDAWKSLIKGSSLQRNCNKEGFNTKPSRNVAKARIGIASNQQNDCNSCDSRIGFGTWGWNSYINTCGNYAAAGKASDGGHKNTRAMCYIFVQ